MVIAVGDEDADEEVEVDVPVEAVVVEVEVEVPVEEEDDDGEDSGEADVGDLYQMSCDTTKQKGRHARCSPRTRAFITLCPSHCSPNRSTNNDNRDESNQHPEPSSTESSYSVRILLRSLQLNLKMGFGVFLRACAGGRLIGGGIGLDEYRGLLALLRVVGFKAIWDGPFWCVHILILRSVNDHIFGRHLGIDPGIRLEQGTTDKYPSSTRLISHP